MKRQTHTQLLRTLYGLQLYGDMAVPFHHGDNSDIDNDNDKDDSDVSVNINTLHLYTPDQVLMQ